MGPELREAARLSFPSELCLTDEDRLKTGEFVQVKGNKISPYLRNPVLIPKKMFNSIARTMLETHPLFRFVILSMVDYQLAPDYQQKDKTHLVVFCMRTVADQIYQPLGIFAINQRLPAAKQLTMIWRTFIEDLSILGITVLASISSVSPIFHGAIKLMTQYKDILKLYNPIIYSVHPFPKIVHLFDHNSLTNLFEDALKAADRIHFLQPMAVSQPEAVSSYKLRLMKTSYKAIKSYQAELGETNMSMYDQRFRNQLEKASYPRGKAWTQGVHSFLTATELVAKLGDMDANWLPSHLTACYEMLEEFRILLATARFGYDIPNDSRRPMFSSGISFLYFNKPFSYRIPGSSDRLCFHSNLAMDLYICFLVAVLYDDREIYQKVISGFHDQYSYHDSSDPVSLSEYSSLSGESATSDDLILDEADKDHAAAANPSDFNRLNDIKDCMTKLNKLAAQRNQIGEIFKFVSKWFIGPEMVEHCTSSETNSEVHKQSPEAYLSTKLAVFNSTDRLIDQLRMKVGNKDVVASGESCDTLNGSTSTTTEANDALQCIHVIENQMKDCAQALAGFLKCMKYGTNYLRELSHFDQNIVQYNYFNNSVDNYYAILNIYLDSYATSTLGAGTQTAGDLDDESTSSNFLLQHSSCNSDNQDEPEKDPECNADSNATSKSYINLLVEQIFQVQNITAQLSENIGNGSLLRIFKVPSETVSLLTTLLKQVKTILLLRDYEIDRIVETHGCTVLTHTARANTANKTPQPNNVPLDNNNNYDELDKLKRFLDGLFTESGTLKPVDTYRKSTVVFQVISNHLQVFLEKICEKRIREVNDQFKTPSSAKNHYTNSDAALKPIENSEEPLIDQTERTKKESYESDKTWKSFLENKNTDKKENIETPPLMAAQEVSKSNKDLIVNRATSNRQTNEQEREVIKTTKANPSEDNKETLIKNRDKKENAQKISGDSEEECNKNQSRNKDLIGNKAISSHPTNEREEEYIQTTELIEDSDTNEHSEKDSVKTEEKLHKDTLKHLIDDNSTSKHQTNAQEKEDIKTAETKPSADDEEALIKDTEKKENPGQQKCSVKAHRDALSLIEVNFQVDVLTVLLDTELKDIIFFKIAVPHDTMNLWKKLSNQINRITISNEDKTKYARIPLDAMDSTVGLKDARPTQGSLYDELRKLEKFMAALFAKRQKLIPLGNLKNRIALCNSILDHLHTCISLAFSIINKHLKNLEANKQKEENGNENKNWLPRQDAEECSKDYTTLKKLIEHSATSNLQTQKRKKDDAKSSESKPRKYEEETVHTDKNKQENSEKHPMEAEKESNKYKSTYKNMIEDNATSNYQTNEREREDVQTTEIRPYESGGKTLIKGSSIMDNDEKQPVKAEENPNKDNGTFNSTSDQRETEDSEANKIKLIEDEVKEENIEKLLAEAEEESCKSKRMSEHLMEDRSFQTSYHQLNKPGNKGIKTAKARAREANEKALIKSKKEKSEKQMKEAEHEEKSNIIGQKRKVNNDKIASVISANNKHFRKQTHVSSLTESVAVSSLHDGTASTNSISKYGSTASNQLDTACINNETQLAEMDVRQKHVIFKDESFLLRNLTCKLRIVTNKISKKLEEDSLLDAYTTTGKKQLLAKLVNQVTIILDSNEQTIPSLASGLDRQRRTVAEDDLKAISKIAELSAEKNTSDAKICSNASRRYFNTFGRTQKAQPTQDPYDELKILQQLFAALFTKKNKLKPLESCRKRIILTAEILDYFIPCLARTNVGTKPDEDDAGTFIKGSDKTENLKKQSAEAEENCSKGNRTSKDLMEDNATSDIISKKDKINNNKKASSLNLERAVSVNCLKEASGSSTSLEINASQAQGTDRDSQENQAKNLIRNATFCGEDLVEDSNLQMLKFFENETMPSDLESVEDEPEINQLRNNPSDDNSTESEISRTSDQDEAIFKLSETLPEILTNHEVVDDHINKEMNSSKNKDTEQQSAENKAHSDIYQSILQIVNSHEVGIVTSKQELQNTQFNNADELLNLLRGNKSVGNDQSNFNLSKPKPLSCPFNAVDQGDRKSGEDSYRNETRRINKGVDDNISSEMNVTNNKVIGKHTESYKNYITTEETIIFGNNLNQIIIGETTITNDEDAEENSEDAQKHCNADNDSQADCFKDPEAADEETEKATQKQSIKNSRHPNMLLSFEDLSKALKSSKEKRAKIAYLMDNLCEALKRPSNLEEPLSQETSNLPESNSEIEALPTNEIEARRLPQPQASQPKQPKDELTSTEDVTMQLTSHEALNIQIETDLNNKTFTPETSDTTFGQYEDDTKQSENGKYEHDQNNEAAKTNAADNTLVENNQEETIKRETEILSDEMICEALQQLLESLFMKIERNQNTINLITLLASKVISVQETINQYITSDEMLMSVIIRKTMRISNIQPIEKEKEKRLSIQLENIFCKSSGFLAILENVVCKIIDLQKSDEAIENLKTRFKINKTIINFLISTYSQLVGPKPEKCKKPETSSTELIEGESVDSFGKNYAKVTEEVASNQQLDERTAEKNHQQKPETVGESNEAETLQASTEADPDSVEFSSETSDIKMCADEENQREQLESFLLLELKCIQNNQKEVKICEESNALNEHASIQTLQPPTQADSDSVELISKASDIKRYADEENQREQVENCLPLELKRDQNNKREKTEECEQKNALNEPLNLQAPTQEEPERMKFTEKTLDTNSGKNEAKRSEKHQNGKKCEDKLVSTEQVQREGNEDIQSRELKIKPTDKVDFEVQLSCNETLQVQSGIDLDNIECTAEASNINKHEGEKKQSEVQQDACCQDIDTAFENMKPDMGRKSPTDSSEIKERDEIIDTETDVSCGMYDVLEIRLKELIMRIKRNPHSISCLAHVISDLVSAHETINLQPSHEYNVSDNKNNCENIINNIIILDHEFRKQKGESLSIEIEDDDIAVVKYLVFLLIESQKSAKSPEILKLHAKLYISIIDFLLAFLQDVPKPEECQKSETPSSEVTKGESDPNDQLDQRQDKIIPPQSECFESSTEIIVPPSSGADPNSMQLTATVTDVDKEQAEEKQIEKSEDDISLQLEGGQSNGKEKTESFEEKNAINVTQKISGINSGKNKEKLSRKHEIKTDFKSTVNRREDEKWKKQSGEQKGACCQDKDIEKSETIANMEPKDRDDIIQTETEVACSGMMYGTLEKLLKPLIMRIESNTHTISRLADVISNLTNAHEAINLQFSNAYNVTDCVAEGEDILGVLNDSIMILENKSRHENWENLAMWSSLNDDLAVLEHIASRLIDAQDLAKSPETLKFHARVYLAIIEWIRAVCQKSETPFSRITKSESAEYLKENDRKSTEEVDKRQEKIKPPRTECLERSPELNVPPPRKPATNKEKNAEVKHPSCDVLEKLAILPVPADSNEFLMDNASDDSWQDLSSKLTQVLAEDDAHYSSVATRRAKGHRTETSPDHIEANENYFETSPQCEATESYTEPEEKNISNLNTRLSDPVNIQEDYRHKTRDNLHESTVLGIDKNDELTAAEVSGNKNSTTLKESENVDNLKKVKAQDASQKGADAVAGKRDESGKKLSKRHSRSVAKCVKYVYDASLEPEPEACQDNDGAVISNISFYDKDTFAIVTESKIPPDDDLNIDAMMCCKSDIFRDRDNFEKVYYRMPDSSCSEYISSMWIATIKGYKALGDLIQLHKIEKVTSRILSTAHSDHFVFASLKQQIEPIKDQFPRQSGSREYDCIDLEAALELFNKNLHEIKQEIE